MSNNDKENNKSKSTNSNKEEPPISTKVKLKYKDFLALILYYKKRIMKQTLPLCKNDMTVIHDLLSEVIDYITLLSSMIEFSNEREQLYAIAMDIINHLDSISKSDTQPSYPIKMKIKLYETRFALFFNQIKDFNQAEIILNDIIKIQNENNFPMFNQASSWFFAALVQFRKILFN